MCNPGVYISYTFCIYLFSFNDQANRDFNKNLLKNIQAVVDDKQYDVVLIKRKCHSVYTGNNINCDVPSRSYEHLLQI